MECVFISPLHNITRYFCIKLPLSFRKKAWPQTNKACHEGNYCIYEVLKMDFNPLIPCLSCFVLKTVTRIPLPERVTWSQIPGLDSKTTCISDLTLLEALSVLLPIWAQWTLSSQGRCVMRESPDPLLSKRPVHLSEMLILFVLPIYSRASLSGNYFC